MSGIANNMKIVFAGAVGAGKTTAISAVSDIEVVNTEELATDDVQLMKATTTVALDYGQLKLADQSLLHLYGAPGQERFDFMWEILAQGALGVIVMIDDACADPFAQIDVYLKGFKTQIDNRSLIMGISRIDLNRGYSLAEYREYLLQKQCGVPVFSVDARDRNQVLIMVKTLLYCLDPWIA